MELQKEEGVSYRYQPSGIGEGFHFFFHHVQPSESLIPWVRTRAILRI